MNNEMTCIDCNRQRIRVPIGPYEYCNFCSRVYVSGTTIPLQGFDIGDRVYFNPATSRLVAVPLEFETPKEIGRSQ